jgi:hypothetical protein
LSDDNDYVRDALEEGTRYLLENAVPACDYTNKSKASNVQLTHNADFETPREQVKEHFKEAIRKVMVLNKRKEIKDRNFFNMI